jgi:hypothetical protein
MEALVRFAKVPNGDSGRAKRAASAISYHPLWFGDGYPPTGSFVPSKVIFAESEHRPISGKGVASMGILSIPHL